MAGPKSIVAVLTGANRGIGRAIAEKLAASHAAPLTLYAISRSGRAFDVASKLPSVDLRFGTLVLTDNKSITALAERIKAEQGRCDVLINNAGIYYYSEETPYHQRKETLDVNYRGTKAVCEAFLPVMASGGRIVNVSSNSGLLKYYPAAIAARFRDPNKTLESIEALVAEYEADVRSGTAAAKGWPPMTYFVSKAALNAVTMILAKRNPSLYINCCCPGWVDTELGAQAGQPPKTLDQGAEIPMRLGFGDIGGVSGEYWANETNRLAGQGSVQVW